MIYDIQRHLVSGDPSDSLSSLSRKKRINLPKLVLEPWRLLLELLGLICLRSKDYIIMTCNAFRPQLEAMIEAEGGHIEGQNF